MALHPTSKLKVDNEIFSPCLSNTAEKPGFSCWKSSHISCPSRPYFRIVCWDQFSVFERQSDVSRAPQTSQVKKCRLSLPYTQSEDTSSDILTTTRWNAVTQITNYLCSEQSAEKVRFGLGPFRDLTSERYKKHIPDTTALSFRRPGNNHKLPECFLKTPSAFSKSDNWRWE